MGTTVLIRIEKEEILTFAPNPAKTFDLIRRLPFITTESKIRRLIKTDSINKLISVAMIKQLKNLRFLALVFLSACIENAPLDSLSPEGPYARSIDELFWLTFWIAVVIFLINKPIKKLMHGVE